jgi:hypothetical protein
MTEQQLKKFIKRPYKFQDVTNYTICFLAIFGGLYFLLITLQIITFRPEHYFDIYEATFLLTIGVYGLWRIPINYKINKINSNKTLEQKRQITENYLSTLNVEGRFVSGELYSISYINKFWNSVDLYVAFNETQFFINVNSSGRGIIDFGLTRRATKKAIEYFNEKASL